MTKTIPVLDAQGRLGFDFEATDEFSIPTLAEIIEAAEANFPGIDDNNLFFEHIGMTPYDLILMKKRPIEFQEVSDGFQKTVHGLITLAQVKREAQVLPDFEKFGFAKTRVLWNKWDFCLCIRE